MTYRPAVALVRGHGLSPYEMQLFAPLMGEFDLLAIGSHHPLHDVDTLPMPTILLRSLGESRALRGIHRRLSRKVKLPGHMDRSLGLRKAVSGRVLLHAAETFIPESEQAAEIAIERGVKLILTCWETIPFRFDEDFVFCRRKLVVKAATALFIAVTDKAKEALITEGVAPERVKVVPTAVDCQCFRPMASSPRVRSSCGVPSDARIVLYVGRLIQEKGLVELVRAFAEGAEDTAHLVIVGSGNQAARVGIAATAFGIASRVHVRPKVAYRELPELYATADIVVAPSLTTPYWEEQFGMVLVEAMACGRPVLTTASGAIPEVVGDSADLVEPYNIAALAEGIRHLLGDASRRDRLAKAGRSRAKTLYDVPIVARQVGEVYRQVLALQ